MGFIDVFSAEDRVEVKFSDFYKLIRDCTEREVLANGLRHKIPYIHILAMLGELSKLGNKQVYILRRVKGTLIVALTRFIRYHVCALRTIHLLAKSIKAWPLIQTGKILFQYKVAEIRLK